MGRRSQRYITILLAPGENLRPMPLFCINVYCGYRLFNVSRETQAVLNDCRGIHWTDVPEDVTVVEVKCHSCKHYYYVYTPESLVSAIAMQDQLDNANVIAEGAQP